MLFIYQVPSGFKTGKVRPYEDKVEKEKNDKKRGEKLSARREIAGQEECIRRGKAALKGNH